MKKIVQEHAWAIQKKLGAEVEDGRRPHTLVKFRVNGVLVCQFGIRRGSKDSGHGHIPKHMHLSQKDCKEFIVCNMSVDEYVQILQDKGLAPI